jgi:hypothetical protein
LYNTAGIPQAILDFHLPRMYAEAVMDESFDIDRALEGLSNPMEGLPDKMTLQVRDLRPRVLSDKVHNDMAELLKFRRFKRYYFNLAYDWKRLDAIVSRAVWPDKPLREDLSGF